MLLLRLYNKGESKVANNVALNFDKGYHICNNKKLNELLKSIERKLDNN